VNKLSSRPVRQKHYNEVALHAMREEFKEKVEARELSESEARKACFEARIPVFFPTEADTDPKVRGEKVFKQTGLPAGLELVK
jgi:hypothetical protein